MYVKNEEIGNTTEAMSFDKNIKHGTDYQINKLLNQLLKLKIAIKLQSSFNQVIITVV